MPRKQPPRTDADKAAAAHPQNWGKGAAQRRMWAVGYLTWPKPAKCAYSNPTFRRLWMSGWHTHDQETHPTRIEDQKAVKQAVLEQAQAERPAPSPTPAPAPQLRAPTPGQDPASAIRTARTCYRCKTPVGLNDSHCAMCHTYLGSPTTIEQRIAMAQAAPSPCLQDAQESPTADAESEVSPMPT